MMPSPPIDDRYDTRHSRWLAAGRAQARIRPLDLQPQSRRKSCLRTVRPLVHPDPTTPVPSGQAIAATASIQHRAPDPALKSP